MVSEATVVSNLSELFLVMGDYVTIWLADSQDDVPIDRTVLKVHSVCMQKGFPKPGVRTIHVHSRKLNVLCVR